MYKDIHKSVLKNSQKAKMTQAMSLRNMCKQSQPRPICCPRQDFTWCPMHYSPFYPI